MTTDRTPAANSTKKKLAVQWLNEILCFVSSSLLAYSFVLRNRQLLVAAKRCGNNKTTLQPSNYQQNLITFLTLNQKILVNLTREIFDYKAS